MVSQAPNPEDIDQTDLQGIVASSYYNLEWARFFLLRITDRDAAKTWLHDLPLTPASERVDQLSRDTAGIRAVNVALTYSGLQKLKKTDVATNFSREFSEGMTAPHRRRVLGDEGASDPKKWLWRSSEVVTADSVTLKEEDRIPGDDIDVLLMLYASDEDTLKALTSKFVRDAAGAGGVREVRKLPTTFLPDNKEHFGFHDGISQPFIQGLDPGRFDKNVVRTGEIVLGYRNFDDQLPLSPYVACSSDPECILLPCLDLQDPDHAEKKDLGKNGSYLVFRQLQQNVAGFWHYAASQPLDPNLSPPLARDPRDAIALASKMVGRRPGGELPDEEGTGTDGSDPNNAEFSFAGDPYGNKVPLGSHIRRTNPRDRLLFRSPGWLQRIKARLPWLPLCVLEPETSRNIVRHHRILRRGRSYGAPFVPSLPTEALIKKAIKHPDDKEERGLYFICLQADIGRQFEFVQGSWLNSPKFLGLTDDSEPIAGKLNERPHIRRSLASGRKRPPAIEAIMGRLAAFAGTRDKPIKDLQNGTFTVQAEPLRRAHHGLSSFVTVRGGAYFFLPSLRARDFFASEHW